MSANTKRVVARDAASAQCMRFLTMPVTKAFTIATDVVILPVVSAKPKEQILKRSVSARYTYALLVARQKGPMQPLQCQSWMLLLVSRVVFPPALNAEKSDQSKEKSTLSSYTCVLSAAKKKVHESASSVRWRKSKTPTGQRNGT